MKRLPPLARAHAKAARAGYAPSQGIMIFDGWSWKRHGMEAIARDYPGAWQAIIPDDADPAEFDWTWTAGFPVLVATWLKANRLESLGSALEAAGVVDCTFLIPSPDGPILLPWRTKLS